MVFECTIHSPAIIESIEYMDQVCQATLGFSKFTQADALFFAVHEAVINAVDACLKKFGEESSQHTVTLSMTASLHEAEIRVIDPAGGIGNTCLERLEHTQFEDILWEEAGRGLLFMKHLVDELWIEQDMAGRNVLVLRKRG